jgi:hypothetical protein
MHRAPERFLIGRSYRSHDQHASGLGLLQKRCEQGLLRFDGKVSMPTTAVGLAPKHALSVTGVV